jgi:DNA repair protein RecO (recombination protein O)
MYYYVDISKIENLNISDSVKKEIDTFLTEYYDKYTGIYLKTKDFLRKIENS